MKLTQAQLDAIDDIRQATATRLTEKFIIPGKDGNVSHEAAGQYVKCIREMEAMFLSNPYITYDDMSSLLSIGASSVKNP